MKTIKLFRSRWYFLVRLRLWEKVPWSGDFKSDTKTVDTGCDCV